MPLSKATGSMIPASTAESRTPSIIAVNVLLVKPSTRSGLPESTQTIRGETRIESRGTQKRVKRYSGLYPWTYLPLTGLHLLMCAGRWCPGIGRAKLLLSRVFRSDSRLGRSLALPKTVYGGMSNSVKPELKSGGRLSDRRLQRVVRQSFSRGPLSRFHIVDVDVCIGRRCQSQLPQGR